MKRIISLNLNGIRSAAKKGCFNWLHKQNADVLCVQELKAQHADMTEEFLKPAGLTGYFHYAEKKGYSGAGVYSHLPALKTHIGFGSKEFDAEGRYVEARFDRIARRKLPKLSIVSCYFPSGSSGEHRQAAKFRFLDRMAPYLEQLGKEREVILVGDINIAHKEIDLRNWKGNRKNSGFLPEERAWMTRLFEELGFVDVFRTLNPHPEQYTWWSNRGQAWAKNVGWRLDYHLATPKVAALARSEHIYLEQRFSDHAPLVIDYDFAL